MRLIRASMVIAAFGLVAASSSSYSVFTLTFERPLGDLPKAKETIERVARVVTPPGGFMEMQVRIVDANRITVSYLQGRPGCSKTPEVDGAVAAMESVKRELEPEYGPVRIEQRHAANAGAIAP